MTQPATEQKPLAVTVYVPCFNAESTIGFCLASLVAQEHEPLEILLIDDGGTDRSVEIAQRYSKVTVVSHERNLGLAAARNTAIAWAKGDLVASIDADCAADPRWLLLLVRDIERNPRTHGCGGKLVEFHVDGWADAWRAGHLPQHQGDAPIGNPPVLPGANTVFRREVLRRVGGYDSRFRTHGEDLALCRKIYEQVENPVLIYEPRAIVNHLRRDTIVSVLRSYWNYQTYASWRNVPRMSARLRLKQLVNMLRQICGPWLRRDLSERHWSSLVVAMVALVYLPWLQTRAWLDIQRRVRALEREQRDATRTGST